MTQLLTEHSDLKPSQTRSRVSSHWNVLKSFIYSDENDTEKHTNGVEVDTYPKTISHGIHYQGKIKFDHSHEKDLMFVALDPSMKCYVALNSEGKICVATSNGQIIHRIKSDECFKGIIFSSKTKQCICWGDSNKLKLFNESFKPVSTSHSLAPIYCAVYNKSTHEVITAGDGNITCWSFRYRGKFLLSRKVITERIENCKVSGICLEDSLSKNQRCFVATGNNIASFNILDGKCLSFLKNRHIEEITCIVFFNPLKNLITAAKDGSIKVWNDDGCLEIAFIGHYGRVNSLAIYPFGHFILSASSDMTLRVWSLESKDEVDKIECDASVYGVKTVVGNDNLYSFTSQGIDLWKIKHIHAAETFIGCNVNKMIQITHPKCPLRIVCICSDAAVRIISGKSGDCITTSLVPDLTTIKDAVYSAGEDLLFTLLVNGNIIKSSTATNPSSLLQVWKCKDLTSPCACLCLYEYIIEVAYLISNDKMTYSSKLHNVPRPSYLQDPLAGTNWKNIIQAAKIKQGNESNNNDRTLLLGGCLDGNIVLFDWKDKQNPGKVIFKIEAHRDEVISIISNPKIDQVVSSGLDNIVKIWRLFPFAEEALAPLMSLNFDEEPRLLTTSHHRLLVARYERSRANYAISVYKTTQKERFDHAMEDEHNDEVVSVSSCPKMRLFASASLDGTLRIWDESNRLKRIIKLNATPSALSFCSERGDMFIAIGKILYRIKYATYLPQSYVYRMVSMRFKDINDLVIPMDEKLLATLSTADQQRVTRARSYSSTLINTPDPMADDESQEKKKEAEQRAVAMKKIQQRENDLKKIRDCELRSSKKKLKLNENQENEAFEKYLSLFYNRTPMSWPETSDDESNAPVYRDPDIYIPDIEPNGFFMIDQQSAISKKSSKEDSERDEILELPKRVRSHSLPIITEEPPLNFDENAVLEDTSVELPSQNTMSSLLTTRTGNDEKKRKSVREKCRHKRKTDVVKGSYNKAYEAIHQVSRESISRAVEQEDQRGYTEISIAPDGYIPNSVVAALFDEMRKKEEVLIEEEEIVPYRPPQLTLAQLMEIKANITQIAETASELSCHDGISSNVDQMNYEEQLRRVLQDTPSPQPLSDDEFPQLNNSSPPETPKSKIPVQTAAEYLATRPPLISPKVLTRSSSLLPIETEEEVFDNDISISYDTVMEPEEIPEYSVRTTPLMKQDPLPYFIIQFKGISWFDKLFPNANPSTFPKPWTIDAFVGLLLIFLSKTPDYELKQNICVAIIVLHGQESFNDGSTREIINVLTQQLNISNGSDWEGNKRFVRSSLQLLKMMKRFTTNVVAQFMSNFILGDEEIRSFIREIFTEIGVQEVNRYFLRHLDEFDVWGVPESVIKSHVHTTCFQWLDKWLSQFKEHVRRLAGMIHRARSGQVVRGTKSLKTPKHVKGILKSKVSKTYPHQSGVSWNFQAIGETAADKTSPVDAINYFSERQLQSEIENARARKHSLKRPDGEDKKPRNTVLILPAIDKKPSLARLGETHCSRCHPEREATYGFRLPPIHESKSIIVNNIALRIKTITLNPFPTQTDSRIYESFQHHQLLTLRSAQKYFFPSRSYVRSDLVK